MPMSSSQRWWIFLALYIFTLLIAPSHVGAAFATEPPLKTTVANMATISDNERNIFVVSVPFPSGFIGTIGNNANRANDVTSFATLGIQAFAFYQMNELGQFALQENDLVGGIRIITQSGEVIDVYGAIN